jgi:lipooligosaccharide transport system permease protein
MRALHVFEHHALVFRRSWRASVFATVVAPIIYLLVMGLGIGRMVSAGFDGLGYLAFLGPGLLAAQAMQTATLESTYPVVAGMQWTHSYPGMARTPIRPVDLVLGHLMWVGVHLLLVGVPFLLLLWALGVVSIAEAFVMMPGAVLTGLAFAAPIAAWSVTLRRDVYVSALSRFIIMPLFLFSGVFFPITALPVMLQAIVAVTPLWNGVALLRSISSGAGDLALVSWNLLVLTATFTIGMVVAVRTYRARLEE